MQQRITIPHTRIGYIILHEIKSAALQQREKSPKIFDTLFYSGNIQNLIYFQNRIFFDSVCFANEIYAHAVTPRN